MLTDNLNELNQDEATFIRDNILPIIQCNNVDEIREGLNKLAGDVYNESYNSLKDEWHKNEQWNNVESCKCVQAWTPSEKYGPEDFDKITDVMGYQIENYKMNCISTYQVSII